MADQTFDVVIVGGGNKALILAMYLTKYGKLNVGIFEERHELGGGWSCEEPAPGYVANTCSMYHVAHYHIPVYQDFPEWKDYGAKYAYTKTTVGCVFEEDNTCLAQYSVFVDPDQEKTASEIARYNKRDADTYLKIWKSYKKYWEPALIEHMFTPACPVTEQDALDKMLQDPDSGIDPLWLTLSEAQIFKDLFEDPHLQHGFARVNQSLGFQWDQTGAGLAALFFTFFFWSPGCYAVGGSHVLAHASHKVILENGGKVFTNYAVEKVLVENGKATGIRLADGSEIKATKAVVTTVDPYQTCFDLLGEEHVDRRILHRVKNLERNWICLMWYTWALNERPRYNCEEWNPDIWDCQWLALGDMDESTFVQESYERKLYKWPSKTNLGLAYHGATELFPQDQLIAPPDKNFTVLTEQFVSPAFALSDSEWKERETQHAKDVIEVWNRYAPNMTWDNVTGYNPVTPYYTANMARNFAPAGNWCVLDNVPSQMGKFRPIPELAGHKMPGVESFYCTGSGWHPYGAGHSAQGYNCYKVIAEDLGLIKPWDKEGRPY